MKIRIEMENFTGKSVLSVYQDFHAKVFAKNLACALAHPSQDLVDQETATRKYKYQINLSQFFSKIKDSIILLFNRENLKDLIIQLIELAAKSVEPIRPDRKSPRRKKIRPRRFPTCYKPLR